MKEKRNLLLITIDCLRPDHLGTYGYPRNTPPRIDRFAEEGLLFRNAITNGCGTPDAFRPLLASTYPDFAPDPDYRLRRTHRTLAQVLRRSGYRTAGYHSNPHLSHHFGYHRGFDTFDDHLHAPLFLLRAKERVRTLLEKLVWPFIFLHRLYLNLPRPQRPPYAPADVITRQAMEWL